MPLIDLIATRNRADTRIGDWNHEERRVLMPIATENFPWKTMLLSLG